MNEVDVNHSYLIDCFQFQVDEVTAASTDNWGFFPPKPNTIIIYVLSLLPYGCVMFRIWGEISMRAHNIFLFSVRKFYHKLILSFFVQVHHGLVFD